MQTLNHHVGYSRENECWFVRFYPYQTEQKAKDAINAFTSAVAPVDGLERYAPKPCDEMQESIGMDRHKYGDYVRFDQAVAIIAAERAEKLKWMEEGFAKQERVWSLEANNAALTARVKEWEKADRLVAAALWEKKVEALETQLAAAKKALEEVKAIAWQRETLPTEKASKEIHRNTAYALCGRLGEISQRPAPPWRIAHDPH